MGFCFKIAKNLIEPWQQGIQDTGDHGLRNEVKVHVCVQQFFCLKSKNTGWKRMLTAVLNLGSIFVSLHGKLSPDAK